MRDYHIETRYANRDDCETLADVISTVIQSIPYYNEQAKRNETAKFKPKDLLEKIETDKYSVILAMVDSSIAGFCLSRFDDFTIWLEWFGILENYRGKGIANLLLRQLDETAKPRQSHKIWCDCRTTNHASIYILQASGYNQLVTLYHHWYNQDFILWEKLMIKQIAQ